MTEIINPKYKKSWMTQIHNVKYTKNHHLNHIDFAKINHFLRKWKKIQTYFLTGKAEISKNESLSDKQDRYLRLLMPYFFELSHFMSRLARVNLVLKNIKSLIILKERKSHKMNRKWTKKEKGNIIGKISSLNFIDCKQKKTR